jgi:hypothetical protein
MNFLLIGALLAASGCAAELGDSADGKAAGKVGLTTQAYELASWVDSVWNRYSSIDQLPLRICIDREPGTTMLDSTLRIMLAFAVDSWVSAVQPITTTPLYNTVDFSCPRSIDGPLWDILAVLHTGPGRAWNYGDEIELYEDDPLFYESLLHELGHSFGLADTYDEATGGCKPGQPSAVMCDSNFQSLQPDDILGAREAFRTVHPDL